MLNEGYSPEEFAKIAKFEKASKKLSKKIALTLEGENILLAHCSLSINILCLMKALGYTEDTASTYFEGMKSQFKELIK